MLYYLGNNKGAYGIKQVFSWRGSIYKTAQAESQEDSSFPADGHQAILNKANQRTNGPVSLTCVQKNKLGNTW